VNVMDVTCSIKVCVCIIVDKRVWRKKNLRDVSIVKLIIFELSSKLRIGFKWLIVYCSS
jgi:hypothetical protein